MLAAPTGKAAARLQDAVAHSKHALGLTPQQADAIPAEAFTLHRLLGIAPGRSRLRYDRDNPLPVDVLVVDETSMVDLALFTRTLSALPKSARLVLLGDRDQLASVEAGSVLGDICRNAAAFSPEFQRQLEDITAQALPQGPVLPGAAASQLQDSVVLLRDSHRFTADSAIGKLAASVNRGDPQISLDNMVEPVQWLEASEPRTLRERLSEPLVAGFSPYLQAVRAGAPPAEVFAAFNRFRVLCAHRQGPFGVDALNTLTEALLHAAGYIDSTDAWYLGRPVMITRNDHRAKLFNGDIGIALQSPGDDGRIRVYFPGGPGDEHGILPARLPVHETVYALSIHKAQGSEFDNVVMVLPDSVSPVVSRELLYTGITRARERLILCGGKGVFEQGVERRLTRSSGLVVRLRTAQ